MKRIFSIWLCGMFICIGVLASTAISFAEEEQHWAEPYLQNLVSQSIMRGDDEGNLNPDNYITRSEFVAMMNRAFGYSNKKGNISFNDVPIEAWYYDDIRVAKNEGYFTGIYPDTAGPETPLKREEAVTMLCRALKIEGVDTDTLQFSDSREFSGWSKAFINAAVEKRFLTGYPDQTFKPADYMTRGEMAKVLSEVAGEIVKDQGSNYIGYANGNVSVVQTGASLRNTIVPGDLYITAGMGTGYTELENLVVGGELIISGTGNAESGQVSVILTDCDINHLVIDSGSSEVMSVRADGGSVISTTTIKSNAYLEEDNDEGIAFRDVILKGPSGTTLDLAGAFENVVLKGEGNKLNLNKGTIESLTVDEDAVKGSVFIEKDAVVDVLYCDTATTVTGTGEIREISINANGCNISMLPDHIYIRPGITAIINGKTMTSLDAEANNADPEFLSGYPKYQDLQAKSVKLLAKTNKPGTVYWAVKNIDIVNRGMTEEDLKTPDKRYVVKSGKVSVVGDKEVTINVTGLVSGVNYEYYMMLEDFKENRTDIEDEVFKTVDVIAPKFLNGTPKIASSTKDSFTMLVMPSKNVTLYWAILPNKAVAPTIESLAELKVSGAIGKGYVGGCEMNDPVEIPMVGTDGRMLDESVTYDIYMVMRDESGNLSSMAKVIGTTFDETPPEFMDGYPWNEPSTETSLKIRHMSTEAGTLYWAVYPFDFEFPPVEDFDSITDAAIKKELQIRAITTGQKAIKNGKATVAEKKDAALSIPGLTKATPYDTYYLLMDKAGNYSEVVALKGIKTKDTTAPVAKIEFDKVLDGNPLISSNISVVFDEIVYYDGADKDIRLSKVPEADKKNILERMFSIHDLLSVTKPDYITVFDFSKAEIGEKDGKTFVTFGQECFGDGKGLNSGGHYQFELNNVVDSDGNAMGQATLLTPFKVVPPQVYMSRFNGDDILADNEIGFSIQRADEINSDKYFDLIIHTNALITFDLYVGDSTTPYAENLRLDAGQARSIAAMNPGGGYQLFTDVNTQDYRLKIKTFNAVPVGADGGVASWDGELKISVMAVIGVPSDLTNLGTAIMNKPNPLEIVKNNADTLVVSNPNVFTVNRVYADSAQPVLIGDIKYETYDTATNVIVMTNKPASLYYVAVPRKNMFHDVAMTQPKEQPTVDQIMAGLPKYLGSKTGTVNIPNGHIEVVELLTELEPDTEYKFFYVLKGIASDGLVVENPNLDITDFETEPPIVPVVTDLMPSGVSQEDSAEMKGTANTPGTVYWIMYTAGLYPDKIGPDNTEEPYFTVDQVMELANSDGTVVAAGNFKVDNETDLDKNLANGLQFKFDCTEMEPTKSYDVFLAMVSEYGEKKSENVVTYKNLRSKDNVPPYVLGNPATTISNRTVTSVGGIEITKYDGSVRVDFSKPLYYKNSLAGDKVAPITEDGIIDVAQKDPSTGVGPVYGSLFNYDRKNINLSAAIYTTKEDDGVEPMTGMLLYFKGVQNKTQFSLAGEIYDKSGWHAGQFLMTFVENREEPLESAFKVEFIKNQ